MTLKFVPQKKGIYIYIYVCVYIFSYMHGKRQEERENAWKKREKRLYKDCVNVHCNFLTLFIFLVFIFLFFFCSFYIIFFQLYKLWGQLHRKKKQNKINFKISFMNFPSIYPIFLVNETHIRPILISTTR